MPTDTISSTLQAIGYILLFVVLVLLWRRAFRQSDDRRVWSLLAAAWTMNLLGNIAWIVYELATGRPLDTLSVIDLFYVSRYVLLGYVLWLYPAPLSGRAWPWMIVTMLAAAVAVWLIYFNPAETLRDAGWAGFVGMALYPVLDAGIVVLAWLRVRATRQSAWSRFAFLLFCAMASYGIANTVNLTEYVFPPLSGGVLQNVFWILTDVFALVLVLRAHVSKPAEE